MVRVLLRVSEGTKYVFFCPGCKCGHYFTIPGWQFNGNMERPTVKPSIKTWRSENQSETICHLFLEDGQIKYLSDCYHELKGQIISMESL